MAQAIFSPGELIGWMVLGLIDASLQRNNDRKPFFITQSRPQLYKSLSGNQMISRIIDNNWRDNKKRVDFFAKSYLNRLT
jgi:hypothetical protein